MDGVGEARERIVAEVVERASGEDEYARETLVAKVRRAVEGEEQPR